MVSGHTDSAKVTSLECVSTLALWTDNMYFILSLGGRNNLVL